MFAVCWQLFKDNIQIAISCSFGQHPVTIYKGEWYLKHTDEWWVSDLYFYMDNYGTEEEPLLLEDVGMDVFVRLRFSRRLWFVDPTTEKTVHSGAKIASNGRPGVRYCWLCRECFSGNNFISQHWKVHETTKKECETCLDVAEGIICAERKNLC
jgi:hypothetical protein